MKKTLVWTIGVMAVLFAMATLTSAATIDDIVGTWGATFKTNFKVAKLGADHSEGVGSIVLTASVPGPNTGTFILNDPAGYTYNGSFVLSSDGKAVTMTLDDASRTEFITMLTNWLQRAATDKGLTVQNIVISFDEKGITLKPVKTSKKTNGLTKGVVSAKGTVNADVWDGADPVGNVTKKFSYKTTIKALNRVPPPPGVEIVAPMISHETFVPFFTMGHDLEYLPFGGIGMIHTGATWTASIEFVNVPEGKYVPRYDGYGIITMDVFGVGPVQAYCEVEWGLDIDQLNVVSGGRNRAEISMSNNPGCEHVGADRFIVDPNYEFDPNHRFAGSVSGENIITIYVDDIEPSSDLDFQVCDEDIGQDCEESPFGIFPDLPDPPDTVWPDPDEWETEEMLIQTESHGDLVAYLVVKPGIKPTYWEVRFQDEEDNVEVIYFRVSNTSNVVIVAP